MAVLGDRYRGRAQFCLVLGFLLTAGVGLFCNATYHEDDLSHFLCARWVGHDPHYLLDVWARPGFTIIHALPAMLGSPALGWHLCRLLSAALHAGSAWLTYRIAVRYSLRHAWLAVPLLYIEPLSTLLSLTTLTETPLAFYLAAATLLLLKRQPTLSALVVSLAPLTRLDAVVFLPLWLPALLQRRAPLLAYPCLLAGLVMQNVLGTLFLNQLPLTSYLQPAGATHYGHGTALTFVVRLFVCAGPVVCALALLGTRRFLSRPLAWLPVTGCVLFILVHTLIYACGSFSSGGYARFLVPLGPWLAVMAVGGVGAFEDELERLRDRSWRWVAMILVAFWLIAACEMALRPPEVRVEWRTAMLGLRSVCWAWSVFLIWAAVRLNPSHSHGRRRPARIFVFGTVWLLIAVQIGWAIRPLRLREEHRIAAEAVAWADSNRLTDRPWLAAHLWVYYWSDRWMRQGEPPFQQMQEQSAPGTLLFWDTRFCRELATPLTLDALRSAADWRERYTSRGLPGKDSPYMVVFERMADHPGAGDRSGTPPRRLESTPGLP